MPIAWFICNMKRRLGRPLPTRYCAMDDFTALIRTDGGNWSESEILGDKAIVKVNALAPTINTIALTPGFRRIPLTTLGELVSSLTPSQRNALRQEIIDAGYTVQELNNAIPDLQNSTLRQVFRFMATRRRKPRYDSATDTIILDGPIQQCKDIDLLNQEVT